LQNKPVFQESSSRSVSFNHISQEDIRQAEVGSATAMLYPMKRLIRSAERLPGEDPMALSCGRAECLSCKTAIESEV
jgi:hypothetical protein